ncbi:MAG: ATP-binding protein [Myxococcota bacterium]
METCQCETRHTLKRIVLTGGPGAGKTAVLELVRQHFCRHVRVLPEAAGVLFGGGFPRRTEPGASRAAQRAIFHVQTELEEAELAVDGSAVFLCDRGTLDGLAYWQGAPSEFWAGVRSSEAEQLSRYDVVIHLRTPPANGGYNNTNRLRTETPEEAALIDERIRQAWSGHPRRFTVESTESFLDKAMHAVELIRGELPECCRGHLIPGLDSRHRRHSDAVTA